MTDRELLEFAAKGAGFRLVYNMAGQPVISSNNPLSGMFCPKPWLPLHDDADAFRLAGKLDMSLTFSLAGFAQACSHDGYFDVDYDGDRQRAMRRAIVLAAAEIGRGM